MIGVGESDTENRAAEAVEEALNSPLLDVDVTGARGALVNVVGDPSLTLEEAEKIVGRVSEALDPEAHVIWGAQISEELKNTIRVMVILSGMHSPYVLAAGGRPAVAKKGKTPAAPVELGLEYLR